MLSKKRLVLTCILALTISFFNVSAHQAADPGPNIIEGDPANENGVSGVEKGYDWKLWAIFEKSFDAQNNMKIVAHAWLQKQRYNHPNGVYFATGGTAYARVYAVTNVAGIITFGDYYIKAKARGRWWYRSNKLKDSYRGGISKQVQKGAARIRCSPTWSLVHLRSEATIDDQWDEVKVDYEWL